MIGAWRSGHVLAVAAAAALVAASATATAGLARPRVASQRRRGVALASLERGVLADVNAYRRRHHLVPLRISAELEAAARQHSDEMARVGYFAHRSADGAAFWKRIQRYYPSGSWSFWSVGENLLWSSPGVTPGRALELWIASPEHRRNLLTARWRQIGVSAVHVAAAPGAYHGLAVTIVTTDFGVRR